MLPSLAKVIGAHAAVLWAAAVSLLLLSGPAWPHATQLSSSRVEVHGNDVAVQLELNGRDLEVALETTLLTPSGAVDADAARRAAAALANYILTHAKLSNSTGAACRARMTDMRPKAEHLLVRVEWACAPVKGRLVYEVTLFQEIDPAARHMLTASGDVSRMALLSVSAPRVALTDTRAQLGEVLWHYFLAGVEHIATGYDHGFGFASVLRDYGIPGDALMPALAAFNLGVEAGQIAIVVLALGLLFVLQRLLRAHAPDISSRALPYAVSAVILLLGLYWTAERLLFTT